MGRQQSPPLQSQQRQELQGRQQVQQPPQGPQPPSQKQKLSLHRVLVMGWINLGVKPFSTAFPPRHCPMHAIQCGPSKSLK